ncbi:Geraniol 8-hydroxylase [Heracleum sosnowskyi]|uniref:Geraniol 8-hydroxylase n=1 Tax=Heracleum sosnowskyi TaxID=360622 RepID=A0AAD8H1Q2_9APIA|nr:Geraniol 8-hydroxylase [Heracleum sosnowskyi]
MDIIVSAVCILLAFALLSLSKIRGKSSQNNPPGPCPLPIIGNIHKLGKHPHKSLASLAQVYGPIMHLKLGLTTTIVISSSSTAQQVLQMQDLAFSSRSQFDVVRASSHNKYSVVLLPVGSRWRSLRKIMSSYIFAANKLDKNQHLRRRKVHDLIRYCEKCCQSGETVDIGRAAFLTSLNLLSNTIFSKDMIDSYENSEAKEFRDFVWNILFEAGKPNLVDYFLILRWTDPQGIRRRMTGYFEKLTKSFDGLIQEHLELRRVGNAESTSTIDVLEELLKMLQTDEIEETHIHNLFIDLFVAGTDTTSNTVEWAMSEILQNSEILVKVKAELNQVIGKGKIIQETDISKLVYLQCIVKETMRLHPPVPFLIPRQVEKEVQLCGYTVPKNSQVLVNAWAIGRDPELWINPLSFRPERICPGMPLAMRMVPVMVGSLINCFDWKLEGGILPEKLDMEEKFGITLAKLHPLRAVATY